MSGYHARTLLVHIWTNEEDATLLRMWGEGKSASLIAPSIGDDITRSAVLGRLHRLRVSGAAPAVSARKWGVRVPSERATRMAVGKRDANSRKPDITLATVQNTSGERRERTSRVTGECPEAPPVDQASIVAVRRAVESQETAATYPHVPILDRKFGQCAFPLWTMDRIPVDEKFCCAAPIERGSYCAEHAKRCYGGWKLDEEETKPYFFGKVSARRAA